MRGKGSGCVVDSNQQWREYTSNTGELFTSNTGKYYQQWWIATNNTRESQCLPAILVDDNQQDWPLTIPGCQPQWLVMNLMMVMVNDRRD